jgi:glyoxylase-like metal-dependent hydrolase (beta-lactamase superfamily II)
VAKKPGAHPSARTRLAAVHEIADGVFQLPLAPRSAVNAYLLGDVLVDAGTEGHGPKVVEALRGRALRAHAITHVHPDHVGGTRAVVDALGIPAWAPAGDAAALAAGHTEPTARRPRGRALLERVGRFPAVGPSLALREGDDLGNGFVVLDTPGHSPGHVSFWRESDRTLVCGDVLFNMSLVTLRAGLREPPRFLTADPARNRASIRRLAALDPAVVAVGHGPVHRDTAQLRAFAAALPE